MTVLDWFNLALPGFRLTLGSAAGNLWSSAEVLDKINKYIIKKLPQCN